MLWAGAISSTHLHIHIRIHIHTVALGNTFPASVHTMYADDETLECVQISGFGVDRHT
jgi:hypothetical protein